jgi:hypothetical protein
MATPLTTEEKVALGAVILFEDTTRVATLSREMRELKERPKR